MRARGRSRRKQYLAPPPTPDDMVYRDVTVNVQRTTGQIRTFRYMWLIPARINHLWSKYKMDMLTKAESEEFMPWYNSKMRELQKLVNGDKQ